MNRREFLRGLVVLPVAGLLAAATVSDLSEEEEEEECEVVNDFVVPPGHELAHWQEFEVLPSNANGTTWTTTSTQGNTSARVMWGV